MLAQALFQLEMMLAALLMIFFIKFTSILNFKGEKGLIIISNEIQEKNKSEQLHLAN